MTRRRRESKPKRGCGQLIVRALASFCFIPGLFLLLVEPVSGCVLLVLGTLFYVVSKP